MGATAENCAKSLAFAACWSFFLALACSSTRHTVNGNGSAGSAGNAGAGGSGTAPTAGAGGQMGNFGGLAKGGSTGSQGGASTGGGAAGSPDGGAAGAAGGVVGWPVDCPTLADPMNGVVDTRSGSPGAKATYSCITGYSLSGEAARTCQDDGTWSGAAPACAINDCGGLTDPMDGSVSAPTTTYGATATYSCATGYGPSGSATRSCQADGSWSGTTPVCVIADCPGLASPIGGTVSAPKLTYNSVATYSCLVGATLSGVATRSCQSNGTWSGTAPTCTAVDCGAPPALANGSDAATSSTYKSVAAYTCNAGYNLSGSTSLTCQANGTWGGGTVPSCALKDCGALAAPSHGSVNASTSTYGSTATYSCSSGYTVSSTASRSCQSSGTWSGTAPTCAAVNCGPLTAPANGAVNVPNTLFGSTATYSCRAGYKVSGSASRTCGASGAWSSIDPVCVRNSCAGGLSGADSACGAQGAEDCCARLSVPGGSFNRGDASSNPAMVSSFSLDEFEVTVGRFRAFVNAGLGTQANPPTGSGWNSTWNTNLVPGGTLGTAVQCSANYQTWTAFSDIRPMNCVTWYEAIAFCLWDGGRLPTALEWDYAAVGGTDQRKYPWGNNAPAADANIAAYGCYYGGSAGCVNSLNIAPVGVPPGDKGKWGQHDMGGNVLEYTRDWYGNYPTLPATCADCSQPNQGTLPFVIAMGGAYTFNAANMMSPALNARTDTQRDDSLGFRCASAP